MSLDIKKSFKFPFTEVNWPEKLLIGGLFVILIGITHLVQEISNYAYIYFSSYIYDKSLFFALYTIKIIFQILFIIIKILIVAIPAGYIIQSAHNEIINSDSLLPDWSGHFKEYFRKGLGYIAVMLLYTFILALICGIPLSLASLTSGLSNSAIHNALISAIIVVIIVPVILIFSFLKPFIATTFAESFDIKQALRIDKILNRVFKVFPEYLASYGLSILLIFGIIFLSVLLVCTCLGIVFLPFIIMPVSLISTNMFAQIYKQAAKEI